MTQSQEPPRCSFCSRVAEDTGRLIAGPKGVYICNECVELCSEILEEEGQPEEEQPFELEHLPTPKEIAAYLDQFLKLT